MILTGCVSRTSSPAATDPLSQPEVKPSVSSYCAVAKPIFWSLKDTDETIRQVKGHNAAWKALCGDAPH